MRSVANIYLSFETPLSSKKMGTKFSFRNSIVKILTTLIRKSNPDFDNKIHDVKHWLIEVDMESELSQREIGIDDKGNTVMIMPLGDNYGFWTDNKLKLLDFEWFSPKMIDAEEFEERWNKFEESFY